MKSRKKKAFTLTELLVVVIVIGILSAAVLPKFSKVIETRKTTEAEELMASVRTEQEKRCALDKPYLASMSDMTDIVKKNQTKNFTITLVSRGIEAESEGKYTYTLKMPSYADGRICCDGTECSKLNKNYPTCEELKGKSDYRESPEDCAAETSDETVSVFTCSGDAEEPCGCKNGGKRTRTCDTTTGTWSAWSECSIKNTCECTGTKPATSQQCNSCGTQTQTVTCDENTGEWVESGFGACSVTDESECKIECTGTKPSTSQTCNSCGNQTRTVTCDTETGKWQTGDWGICNVSSPSSCGSGTAKSAVFYVFSSNRSEAYYSGDSALCGCGCTVEPILGTSTREICTTQEQAQKVCDQGGKGCVSSIPTVDSRQVTTPSTYECIGKKECFYTGASSSNTGHFVLWADETKSSMYTCESVASISCSGVSFGTCVDSACSETSCIRLQTYKCLEQQSAGRTCYVPAYQVVNGYICSDYARTVSNICSSSAYSDACSSGYGYNICGAGV
ncbi:MAG: type IV pilin protein [Candidatus Avelusimicrobium sp.]|uniref:type IV pilin protein n=1 Tax=Candidatus Avelusimicrobium sp. TaxID=3048833 RepID=UPI003F10B529